MQLPRGMSMSVIMAAVRRPALFPVSTMSSASSTASGRVFMKAPEPSFTSSKIASAPAASFFDIMLAAIRGRLSTVFVTSRRA